MIVKDGSLCALTPAQGHPQKWGPAMKIAIVYESMFGNTHQISEGIADGAGRHATVVLLPASEADAFELVDVDVLIVGGPTHALTMSTPESRDQAAAWARNPAKNLRLEPDMLATGMREWLAAAGQLPLRYAAFDTRVDFMKIFPGAAAGFDKALRKRGATRLAPVRSFAVNKSNVLKSGERESAIAWGDHLAALAAKSLAKA